MLAKPDVGDGKQVMTKIYDPRYLEKSMAKIASCSSYPWNFANGQAAAMAWPQNSELSDEELVDKIYFDLPGDLNGEDLTTRHLFWEERFYCLSKNSYNSELSAYERLKHLQGSAIPRLIMAGRFLPPDERVIQLPFPCSRIHTLR